MYYVLSQGEQPVKIFFDEAVAMLEGADYRDAYLDLFDNDGRHMYVLKLVVLRDDIENFDYEWTKDF